MKISTLIFSFKQGNKNIKSNKMFSFASIGTIATCIFVVGLFYTIVTNVQYMVKTAEKTIPIAVFFDEGLDTETIEAIGVEIENYDNVDKVEFISAEEAWEQFKKDNFGDDPTLGEFDDDNPLANSASYQITLKDLSKQDETVSFLNDVEGIRKVRSADTAAKGISSMNMLIGYVSLIVSTILLFIAVFLISNTVMIGISVRKDEIAIMKLIGATDFFIRAPFIVEGLVIGFIGAIIPMVILYFGYTEIVKYILNQFDILSNWLEFRPVWHVFSVLVPLSLVIGVGIGFVGSFFTLRKHLKV